MDKLIYAAVGLGAAYLIFGNKGTNAPIPPAGGGGGPYQPDPSTVPPRPFDTSNVYDSQTLPAYTTPPAYTTSNEPRNNIGAARGYGNCMCRDGSQCVGQGNCACCDKRGGAIAPHTVILPFVKRAVAPVVKTNSANILG